MSTFQTISQMNTPDQIDERSHKSFSDKATETCYTKVSTGSNPYMNYMGDEWGGTFEIWKHELTTCTKFGLTELVPNTTFGTLRHGRKHTQ